MNGPQTARRLRAEKAAPTAPRPGRCAAATGRPEPGEAWSLTAQNGHHGGDARLQLRDVCLLAVGQRLAGQFRHERQEPFRVHRRRRRIRVLVDKLQPLLNAAHGLEVVVGHGLVVDAGVDHGRVHPPVAHEPLDGGHVAAGVDQLGGKGMAQHVGRDVHPDLLPHRLEPVADQLLGDGPAAVEEDVVRGAVPAHFQVPLQGGHRPCGEVDGAVLEPLGLAQQQPLLGQVQVGQGQVLQLTESQTSLPEQVETGQVEQPVAPALGGGGRGQPLEVAVAQRG